MTRQMSFLLIISLIFFALTTYVNAKLDAEECRSYGFDETLFCDKCDILKEFIEDDCMNYYIISYYIKIY